MSHIVEGVLHAYLDGALDEYSASEAKAVRAHLETCAECASRLEEERRVRDAASSILALSAPRGVEPPDFEELAAYVKATRPATRRASARLYRLGWAASIVLALGVGWMARGGELERGLMSRSPAAESAISTGATDASAEQPSVMLERASSAPSETAPAGAGSGSTGEAVVAAPSALAREAAESTVVVAAEASDDRQAEALSDRAPLPAAPVEERQVAAAADAGADSARAVDAAADRVVEAPPAEAVAVPEPAGVRAEDPPLVERAVPEANAAADLATVGTQLLTPPAAAAPPVPAPDEPARRRAIESERARERLAAQIDLGAAAPAPVAGVRTLAPASAVTIEADDLLAVPDVELVSVANLVEGTSPAGIHVVQRLENGEILDVYHLPEGVDPSVLPPVEAMRNEVRAPRVGGWVVLRARLSTEELRALLARLVPEA